MSIFGLAGRCRLHFGNDDLLTGNALHDCRLGVIGTERITEDKPFAIWNFERKVFVPLDLDTRRFHGSKEAIQVIAAICRSCSDRVTDWLLPTARFQGTAHRRFCGQQKKNPQKFRNFLVQSRAVEFNTICK